MKILHIIPYYKPAYGFGGPLTVCSDYAEFQAKSGHAVTIATTNVLNERETIDKSEEFINGVRVLRFPIMSPYFAKKFNIYFSFGFKKWYKKNCSNYDIVHIHDFFTPQNIEVLKNIDKQPNYIVQPHGSSVPIRERGRQLFKILFNMMWGKEIMNRARKIIAISETEQKMVSAYFGILTNTKIEIIGNGIDNSKIKSLLLKLGSVNHLRKKYLIPNNVFVYLYFGRIHKIKNLDLILDSFIALGKAKRSVLVFAGEDNGYLDILKEKVKLSGNKTSVFFFNDHNSYNKYELYKLANAYLLFSKSDPFGLTLLEASSCGLPLGVSKSVGLSKDIKDLGCGVLLNELTVKDARSCLLELNNHSSIFSGRAHQLAERYDLKNQGRNLIKLYKDAIS